MQSFGELVVEDVFNERAFTAAANTSEGGEYTERNLHVDVFEIVVPCTDDFEKADRGSAGLRNTDRFLSTQVGAGDAAARFADFIRGAGCHNLSAEAAGAGAEIEQAV